MTSSGRTAVTALAVLATLAPATAAHAADLPANSRDGITLRASKKTAVFTFASAKSYRAFANSTLSISCKRLTDTPLGPVVSGSGSDRVRAPKRGRSLRAKALVRGTDFCTISSVENTVRKGGKIKEVQLGVALASVPLTKQGAAYVEESVVASKMALATTFATQYALDHKRRFPTFAQLKTEFTKTKVAYPLVALPNAAGTPPFGKVGYFSDGSTSTAVAVAATGRRLYFEVGPDDRVVTNTSAYVFTAAD